MANRHILNKALIIIILSTITSCYENDIQKTLRQAGDNRPELELVLDHYARNASDSLKLKAAKFLIANMQYHGFQSSDDLDTYFCSLDSINRLVPTRWRISSEQDSLYKLLGNAPIANAKTYYDSRMVKSDDLIRQIDDKFIMRDTSIWCRNLSFDDFCEYILPYRIVRERLSFQWESCYRDSITSRTRNSVHDTMSNKQKLDKILERLQTNYRFQVDKVSNYPSGFTPQQLYAAKRGTCRDFSVLGCYYFRSIGVPCTIDYTPQWGNRSMGHDWNVCFIDSTVIDTTGHLDFDFAGGKLPIGQHMIRNKNRLSKVYRETFSANKESLAAIHGKESIPQVFYNPCIKDVSELYGLNQSVTIQIPDKEAHRFYYLATFNNQEWKPIAWTEKDGSQATFCNLGANIIYLPCVYENGNIRGIDYPILVQDSCMHKLIPDQEHLQDMILYRKYSTGENIARYSALFAGGRIEVAEDRHFKHGVKTLHSFTDTIPVNFNRIEFNLKEGYRYIRFVGGKGKNGGEVAELEVYDIRGNKLQGTVIGVEECTDKHPLSNAFDGDALTYYQSADADRGWVGLDLESPHTIGHIRILPHNDDNFIRNGELYELQYWALSGWVAIGEQNGTTSQCLTFQNCPSGALYRLRNLSKGKEERIFNYEDGKQVWW